MGANHLVALLVAAQTVSPDTSSPYSSPAVQHLVERAMARRHRGDSAVTDYRARIRYRLTVGLGRRRWADTPAAAVEEQIAEIQWQRPNDLRVDVLGRRYLTRTESLRLSSVWDRPWFVPRGVDDSVRIFSDRFPARGALHPLAAAGPAWYRYELATGLAVTGGPGGTLRLLRVDVTPRREGPALIAGQMWIDSVTAEVARLTFRYVGTGLWVRPKGDRGRDSSSARRINRIANEIASIDADLEYGLEAGRYWMPRRQVIAGRVRIPVVSDLVIPFRATTTFEEVEVNTGRPIAFEVPLPDSGRRREADRRARRARLDSLRAERSGGGRLRDPRRAWNYAGRWQGGRYELHRPSNDSLARYEEWPDSLTLDTDPADARRFREVETQLATLAEDLPDSVTGRSGSGFGYQRPSDALRYNRVQGVSFGLGYRLRVPGIRFTSLYGTVRYGFSDERVTGRLSVIRDAPGSKLTLSGYRDIDDLDPLGSALGVGNTVNALVAAHDNADWVLVEGGLVELLTPVGPGLDLSVGARVERQSSVARAAKSGVNDFLGGDGVFPPNPPVDEGTYGGGQVRLTGEGARRWTIAADVLGGEGRTTGRLYGSIRQDVGGEAGATLRLAAGLATAPTLAQSLFRLGGLSTVRGFDYGTRRGQAFWAARLDLAPIGGRIRPVLFIDAGQAGSADGLFDTRALVGAGAGVSFFNGLCRFELSQPISPDTGDKVRFDIVVQGVR
jgi:hypothetical protein